MIASDTVQMGENIVSLASRLTGDPMNWQEIVRLNKLRAPYITADPSPTTLSPGEAVLYPAPSASVSAADGATLAARTYKRDLRAERGDLVLSGPHLTTLVGLDNLKAALTRRLITLTGAHPFHPRYGSLLTTHLGAVAHEYRLRLACVDAKAAIMRDPRVQDCAVSATWNSVQEMMTMDLDVTPIAPGERFRFTYSF